MRSSRKYSIGLLGDVIMTFEALLFARKRIRTIFLSKYSKAAGHQRQTKHLAQLKADLVPQISVQDEDKSLEPVDLVLDRKSYFSRWIDLPRMPKRLRAKAIELEMTSKTPFTSDAFIWCVEEPIKTATGYRIRQHIAKRGVIEREVASLRDRGFAVRSIWPRSPSSVSPMTTIKNPSKWRAAHRLANLGTIAALGIIALGSAVLDFQSQNQRAEQLKTSIAETEQHIRQAHQNSQKSQSETLNFVADVEALKGDGSLTNSLVFATSNLPDHVFLSSFSYQPDGSSVSGKLRGSAAELLLKLAQDHPGADASLVGPVSKDPEGFEEFQIRFSTPLPMKVAMQ